MHIQTNSKCFHHAKWLAKPSRPLSQILQLHEREARDVINPSYVQVWFGFVIPFII